MPDIHPTNDQPDVPLVAANRPGLASRIASRLAGVRIPSFPLGELVSRRVHLPAWLVVVLAIALVAGPLAVTQFQTNLWGVASPGPVEVAVVEPTATEEPDDDDEMSLLALEAQGLIDTAPWIQPDPLPVSSREQYLLDQGVDPDLEVRYAADEVERLQGELEAIQRNSALLRSLTRQQSGDLSAAYSSLELTQEDNEGVLEDLQGRIDELEGQIQSVDDLARELRDLLGLATSESGVGGPRPSNSVDDSEDVNPWQALRDDIVHIEQWAGELVFDLDEVNTEIQLRIARLEQAQAQAQTPIETGSSLSENIAYYDSMPMGWPVEGPLTSRFGMRSSPFAGEDGAAEMHTGIDIAARTGTPVTATGGGTVQIAGENGGYGLLVVIDHGGGVTSWYGHNSRLLVTPGQRVNAGDAIAEVGSTGRSTGPHVHYEVRVNGVPEDPLPYMQMNR